MSEAIRFDKIQRRFMHLTEPFMNCRISRNVSAEYTSAE